MEIPSRPWGESELRAPKHKLPRANKTGGWKKHTSYKLDSKRKMSEQFIKRKL